MYKRQLLDFRYERRVAAEAGQPGGAKRCFGKSGADCVIPVPRGTLIYDDETGRLMADMSGDEPFVAAKGGRGGWGNSHFATATRQVPRFAKPGVPGEEKMCIRDSPLSRSRRVRRGPAERPGRSAAAPGHRHPWGTQPPRCNEILAGSR